MPETLSVRLNRVRLHSIEVPESFATEDSFTVALDNHGEATHAHLRLDEALSEVASIATTNHYVRSGATERVPVIVHEAKPISGTLTVATAYGSESESIPVRITEPADAQGTVEIDASLVERTQRTEPAAESTGTGSAGARSAGASRTGAATASPPAGPAERGFAPSRGMALGGALALVLAGIVLVAIEQLAVVVGGLAILLGAVAFGYFLLR
jgi:hypothetical protein